MSSSSSLDMLKRRFSVFKSRCVSKSESSQQIETRKTEQIRNQDLKRVKKNKLNGLKSLKEIDILKDKPHYIRGSLQKDENGQVKLVSPLGNYCG